MVAIGVDSGVLVEAGGGGVVGVWVGSGEGVGLSVGIDVGVIVKVPLGIGVGSMVGGMVNVAAGGSGLSGKAVKVLVATLGTQMREPATIKSLYRQFAWRSSQTGTR